MFKTIPDIPLSDISQDILGRENLVDLIVESINCVAQTESPCMVYGIYGKWGEGKTTLMHFIKNKLVAQGKKDKITLVEYNPWLVNNDEALLQEFFNSILTYPDETVRELFKKYGSLAILASKTIVNAFVPGVGTALAEGIELAKNAFEDSRDSISEMKQKVSKAILESGRHLVVMIDDVDRLDKEELHTLLRLVRQIADFPNCIYIIAMDVDMVAKAIGDYHETGTAEDGRKYLDKIVQIPITLPRIPESEMRVYVQKELTKMLEAYVSKEHLTDIVDKITPFIDTIRSLKRYCNQLSFVIPHLKDEVNINDLCLLEVIKNVTNESYDRIYEKRSSLLREIDSLEYSIDRDKAAKDADDRYMQAVSYIVENLTGKKKDLVRTAINDLFDTSSIEGNEDLNRKRICTSVYFTKYFVQKVPSDIIPDRVMDDLKSVVAEGSVGMVAAKIDEWLEHYSVQEIKRAAMHIIDSFSSGKEQSYPASILARSLAVCRLSKNLPTYLYLNNDDVSTYIPVAIIQRYMFYQSQDYVEQRAWDDELLDETLSYIFKESEMNFCMNMLTSTDLIFNCGTYDGRNVLPFLIERFKSLSFDEQFKYSSLMLTDLFKYWKKTDPDSFNIYSGNLFSNPDIPYLQVFDKFLNGTNDLNDVDSFVRLFYVQIPQIINRIETDTAGDPFSHHSVKLYYYNYKPIVDAINQH